jgi:phage/plasmid-like protein (TIGR03299 family)
MTTIAEVAEPVHAYQLEGFTHRSVPWGKLGATIDGGAFTAAEAAVAGKLDFDVELLQAGFRVDGSDVATEQWRTVTHRRAVVRQDTKKFMSFVSDDYVPVQYREAFTFMDEINPNYVAAGTLGEGRQAFMVVELPDRAELDLVMPDGRHDPHRQYVVLRTSHDMTRAIEVCVLMLRDKCMNALTLSSFSRGAKQRWSVRHVGDPIAKLAVARETLARTDAYTQEFVEFARSLAAIDADIEQAREVLDRVLPNLPRRPQQINSIVHAWNDPNTNGFAGTGWGLTNAVSDYFEHGRSNGLRTNESFFTSGLNGQTHRYVNRTAQLLLRRR